MLKRKVLAVTTNQSGREAWHSGKPGFQRRAWGPPRFPHRHPRQSKAFFCKLATCFCLGGTSLSSTAAHINLPRGRWAWISKRIKNTPEAADGPGAAQAMRVQGEAIVSWRRGAPAQCLNEHWPLLSARGSSAHSVRPDIRRGFG